MNRVRRLLRLSESNTAVPKGTSYGYSYSSLAKDHGLVTRLFHSKFGTFLANTAEIYSGWPGSSTEKDGTVYYALVSKDKKYGINLSSTSLDRLCIKEIRKDSDERSPCLHIPDEENIVTSVMINGKEVDVTDSLSLTVYAFDGLTVAGLTPRAQQLLSKTSK